MGVPPTKVRRSQEPRTKSPAPRERKDRHLAKDRIPANDPSAIHDTDATESEDRRFPLAWIFPSPRLVGGVGVSMFAHAALLVALALLTVVLERNDPERTLSAAVATDEPIEKIEEIVEVELEKIEDVDTSPPGQMSMTEVDTEFLGSVAEVPQGVQPAPLGSGLVEVDDIFGGRGAGQGVGEKGAVSFFGVESRGDNFVYVVDNSKSMKNGRFEKAVYELFRSVQSLNRKQRFYVIFFSDKDYPLFHPRPARNLVPATDENKRLLRAWAATVPLVLKTNAEGAMKRALWLRPDAIYLLTDGKFTDGTELMLMEMERSYIPIHTIGFEDRRGEKTLKRISAKHGGTYRFVE